jgi:hypothetical protein
MSVDSIQKSKPLEAIKFTIQINHVNETIVQLYFYF